MQYNLYLAPMEEITGYTFRNTLEKYFGAVDKYFTPFITPNQNKILKTKDGREILPEHNKGLKVVPQLLTNKASHFNDMSNTLFELGYEEINLNFGCPSNTVVKKYKGSGILKDIDILEGFLEGIFEKKNDKISISVKSRLGCLTDDYFDEILDIYNKFPISELIIHPRIQSDYYNGSPRMEKFVYAIENSKAKLCYNGDIFNLDDYNTIISKCSNSNVTAIMIGRGAVANPGIFREIREGKKASATEMHAFIEELYESYSQDFGARNSLFKMKEVWSYFQNNELFENIDISKDLKVIKKSTEAAEYKLAVKNIFRTSM